MAAMGQKTMMTPAEREFAIQFLDESSERILRLLGGLSTDQLLHRAQPGCWSVAENVEHLVVVERRLVAGMEKLLQEPPDFEKQCSLPDEELVRRVATVVRPVQAPAAVLPTLRWPAENLLQEFESTRRRTRDFAAATNCDLRHHFMNHFVFGDLDCYQWILLIGAHSNRHCAQAERVKSCPDFPARRPMTKSNDATSSPQLS
jgi:hypothetical protein